MNRQVNATSKIILNGKYTRSSINYDLHSTEIYSRSEIQRHIRNQYFQELLTKMEIKQGQTIDQNLRKLAETAGFSNIYAQNYSGILKISTIFFDRKNEKLSSGCFSPINLFGFFHMTKVDF